MKFEDIYRQSMSSLRADENAVEKAMHSLPEIKRTHLAAKIAVCAACAIAVTATTVIFSENTNENALENETPLAAFSESDSEESIPQKTYTVRTGFDSYCTVDNPEYTAKIDDWLQRAFDSPQTREITDNIERSGSYFEIKTSDTEYQIDLFPEDYDIENATETDENGKIRYQYNVTANGSRYQVPIELTYELADIIEEATGVDVRENYDFL